MTNRVARVTTAPTTIPAGFATEDTLQCQTIKPFRSAVDPSGSAPILRLSPALTPKRHQCFGLSFPRRLPTQPDERAMAEASRYGAAKSS
jgi:hypothetical protein